MIRTNGVGVLIISAIASFIIGCQTTTIKDDGIKPCTKAKGTWCCIKGSCTSGANGILTCKGCYPKPDSGCTIGDQTTILDCPGRTTDDGGTAVSYTHLRAHETPEHLV